MKTLILILLTTVGLASMAQQKENLSKIKLKDGSELNVLIKANIPGEYITVEIPGNEDATIAYDNIASIKQSGFKYHAKYYPTKQWYWDGSFGLVFGQTSDNGGARAGFEAGATFNYRIFPLLSAGVGIEPMVFFVNNETIFVPVFARFKGVLYERRTTAFYSFDYGYSFAQKTSISEAKDVHGGWFARPTIGLQAGNFAIGIGYQLQKVTTTNNNRWWWGNDVQVVEDRLMKNLVFVTSFTF